jgi:hypothetical protein
LLFVFPRDGKGTEILPAQLSLDCAVVVSFAGRPRVCLQAKIFGDLENDVGGVCPSATGRE